MEALGGTDPRQIGDFRLLRRLGAGGMGQVYLGRTAGGRTVAVKTVRGEFAADHEFRVRFRQEMLAARQVGGRWTAPVLDADTEGPQPWVATGYVAGPSLAAAVREFGPLPGPAVRVLGAGLAEALAAVHGAGLVHRDVKPSNVLLALDGPRLIDFGIARSLDAATALTRSGFVIGSPGYLSPEQAQGQVVGAASDVFSLAAVLAFAATGSAPFGEGASAPVLLYRVVHEAPDLRQLGAVDQRLQALIAACLAKEPSDRPTPDQLREELSADPAAGVGGDWLPPAVAGSVARLAVELLDLDTEAVAADGASSPGPGVPADRFEPPIPVAPSAPAPWPATVTASGVGPVAPPTGAGPGLSPSSGSSQPERPLPSAAPQPQPSGFAASRGRGPVLVGAAVAVLLAAGLAFWFTRGTGIAAGGRHGNQKAGSAPNAVDSPEATGKVPNGYLGTWSGALGTPIHPGRAEFRITIGQGAKGDPVGSIHNNTGPGTGYCDSNAVLVSADANRLVLKTSPTTGLSGCVANPAAQVYTRNADGSLHLEVDGFTGDLARQR